MADTKIPWTDKSWNPVVGCSKVSAGCQNCYAERLHNQRHKAYCEGTEMPEQYDKPFCEVQLLADRLDQPFHWKKPCKIFVCSMSDLFHPKVSFEFIDGVFATIQLSFQHTFQLLTKRPEILLKYATDHNIRFPQHNIHFGVSIENQKTADERIPILLQIPAAVRWVSLEPMLGPVDLKRLDVGPETVINSLSGQSMHHLINGYGLLDWVVVGCESGPKRRPCKLEWVRNIVEQCNEANVPVFVKQLDIGGKVVKKIEQFPKDLQIQEYPG